jgi:probable HAF family extracellular repeat protein
LILEQLEDRCLLSYTITDLGTLGGDFSYAFGINNADPVQVIGESNIGAVGSPFQAFVWDSTNGIQNLGTLGGSSSVAYGINDAGQVVGWASTQTAFAETAFLWDNTNGMQALSGLPGDKASRAFAINNLGQVVGWSGTTYFLNGRAVMWDGGSVSDLGTVGNLQSAAHGINDLGQVVGTAGGLGGLHALLWEDGSIQDLGGLSSWGSTAAGINNRGHVVGITYAEPVTGAFLSNPYLYTTANGLTDIGTADDCPPGWDGLGGGAAINDHNQVVGYLGCIHVQPPIQDYTFPAVWSRAQGWQNLNDVIPPDSGWNLDQATAINNEGQIVGYGRNPDGQSHAFLLTPDGASTSLHHLPLDPLVAAGFASPAALGPASLGPAPLPRDQLTTPVQPLSAETGVESTDPTGARLGTLPASAGQATAAAAFALPGLEQPGWWTGEANGPLTGPLG